MIGLNTSNDAYGTPQFIFDNEIDKKILDIFGRLDELNSILDNGRLELTNKIDKLNEDVENLSQKFNQVIHKESQISIDVRVKEISQKLEELNVKIINMQQGDLTDKTISIENIGNQIIAIQSILETTKKNNSIIEMRIKNLEMEQLKRDENEKKQVQDFELLKIKIQEKDKVTVDSLSSKPQSDVEIKVSDKQVVEIKSELLEEKKKRIEKVPNKEIFNQKKILLSLPNFMEYVLLETFFSLNKNLGKEIKLPFFINTDVPPALEYTSKKLTKLKLKAKQYNLEAKQSNLEVLEPSIDVSSLKILNVDPNQNESNQQLKKSISDNIRQLEKNNGCVDLKLSLKEEEDVNIDKNNFQESILEKNINIDKAMKEELNNEMDSNIEIERIGDLAGLADLRAFKNITLDDMFKMVTYIGNIFTGIYSFISKKKNQIWTWIYRDWTEEKK